MEWARKRKKVLEWARKLPFNEKQCYKQGSDSLSSVWGGHWKDQTILISTIGIREAPSRLFLTKLNEGRLLTTQRQLPVMSDSEAQRVGNSRLTDAIGGRSERYQAEPLVYWVPTLHIWKKSQVKHIERNKTESELLNSVIDKNSTSSSLAQQLQYTLGRGSSFIE